MVVWLVRREASMDNLDGIAGGFAYLANGSKDTAQLKEFWGLIGEMANAASGALVRDEDQSKPWRP
jgi:hypothetical protein